MPRAGIETLLRDVPLFRDLQSDWIETVAGCGSNVRFRAGERLFSVGDDATALVVVRHGAVQLDGGRVVEAGRVVGWPWLLHPYRWPFGARALTQVRATALDGACLRVRCEYDYRLGYHLASHFAATLM